MTTTINDLQHAAAGEDRYPVPSGLAFIEGGETVDFLPDPDLEDLACELIAREELHLGHLRDLRIASFWKRQGGASKGKDTLGTCLEPSGLLKHFSGMDFVIWLAADHCRALAVTRAQVEAALAHELMHAAVDEAGNPTVQGHDVEMFRREVSVFGFWKADLQRAADTFQARLDLGGAA